MKIGKIKKRNPRRKFKLKEKLKIIRVHRKNGFSIRKTALIEGLYRSTLRKWLKDEPKLLASNNKRFREKVQKQ